MAPGTGGKRRSRGPRNSRKNLYHGGTETTEKDERNPKTASGWRFFATGHRDGATAAGWTPSTIFLTRATRNPGHWKTKDHVSRQDAKNARARAFRSSLLGALCVSAREQVLLAPELSEAALCGSRVSRFPKILSAGSSSLKICANLRNLWITKRCSSADYAD